MVGLLWVWWEEEAGEEGEEDEAVGSERERDGCAEEDIAVGLVSRGLWK